MGSDSMLIVGVPQSGKTSIARTIFLKSKYALFYLPKYDKKDNPEAATNSKEFYTLLELMGKGEISHIAYMPDHEHDTIAEMERIAALALQMQSITVIIDEAWRILPKHANLSESAHYTARLFTEGQGLDIRAIAVTQRPQLLHNSIILSCNCGAFFYCFPNDAEHLERNLQIPGLADKIAALAPFQYVAWRRLGGGQNIIRSHGGKKL